MVLNEYVLVKLWDQLTSYKFPCSLSAFKFCENPLTLYTIMNNSDIPWRQPWLLPQEISIVRLPITNYQQHLKSQNTFELNKQMHQQIVIPVSKSYDELTRKLKFLIDHYFTEQ